MSDIEDQNTNEKVGKLDFSPDAKKTDLITSAAGLAGKDDPVQTARALRDANLIRSPNEVSVEGSKEQKKYAAVLAAIGVVEENTIVRAIDSGIEQANVAASQAHAASESLIAGLKFPEEVISIGQEPISWKNKTDGIRLLNELDRQGVTSGEKSREYRQSVFGGFASGLALGLALREGRRVTQQDVSMLRKGWNIVTGIDDFRGSGIDFAEAKDVIKQSLERAEKESGLSNAVVRTYFTQDL